MLLCTNHLRAIFNNFVRVKTQNLFDHIEEFDPSRMHLINSRQQTLSLLVGRSITRPAVQICVESDRYRLLGRLCVIHRICPQEFYELCRCKVVHLLRILDVKKVIESLPFDKQMIDVLDLLFCLFAENIVPLRELGHHVLDLDVASNSIGSCLNKLKTLVSLDNFL